MSSGSDSGSGRNDTRLAPRVGLDEAAVAEQRAFFELAADDERLLRALQPAAEASIDGIVDAFYAHLVRFPELRDMLLADPGRIERSRYQHLVRHQDRNRQPALHQQGSSVDLGRIGTRDRRS